MTDVATARALLESLGAFGAHFTGEDVAHLEVNGNEVVGSHLVPGWISRWNSSMTGSRRTSACGRG